MQSNSKDEQKETCASFDMTIANTIFGILMKINIYIFNILSLQQMLLIVISIPNSVCINTSEALYSRPIRPLNFGHMLDLGVAEF